MQHGEPSRPLSFLSCGNLVLKILELAQHPPGRLTLQKET